MKSGKNYVFTGARAKEVGLALNGEINNLAFFEGVGAVGVIEERFAPFLCVLSPNINMT